MNRRHGRPAHRRSVPAAGAAALHEEVAEQLRDAILDGRFRAGQKLPPERELAAEFQVNRTSVREAIKVLEGLGPGAACARATARRCSR